MECMVLKKMLQNPFFKNLVGTENLTSLTVKSIGNLNMMVFGVQPLALGPTVDTYVKYDQFEHFIPSKCQHFERITCTLWSLLVQSSALKGFPSFP